MVNKSCNEVPNIVYAADTLFCDCCGRPMPKRKKGARGPRKQRHAECVIVMSRISELESMVAKMRFMPPATTAGSNALQGHAKVLRARLFGLSRLLTSKTTRCATGDRSYYKGKAKR